MSYCRWDRDSALYIYDDVRGYLCCCSCPFNPRGPGGYGDDFTTTSRRAMAAHIRDHIKAGHRAQESVATELEEEAKQLCDDVTEDAVWERIRLDQSR